MSKRFAEGERVEVVTDPSTFVKSKTWLAAVYVRPADHRGWHRVAIDAPEGGSWMQIVPDRRIRKVAGAPTARMQADLATAKGGVRQLCDLIREAGVRVTFDPNRSMTDPCVGCGTLKAPRELVQIGTYTRPMGGGLRVGDPIVRPMCEPCREATEPSEGEP